MQPTTSEEVDRIDVHGIDVRTIIREHGSQGTADDLTSVDHGDDLAVQLPSRGFAGVVTSWTLLQYLDAAQCCAGQQAFLCVGRVVEKSHVAVEVGAVCVAKAFDVAFVRDAVSQIIVLAGAAERFLLTEDGVVHDDAVNSWVVVGIHQRSFNVDGVFNLAQFVSQPVVAACLARPFRVFDGSRVFVGQQPHQQRRLKTLLLHRRNLRFDFIAEWRRNNRRVDLDTLDGIGEDNRLVVG
mmetsp:Transcript_16160/g.44768  ORF Transcript_16160/g.44768 Transcript_16160/m.44768 type:complete len:239 (+) Transcript_16160:660-1376(+)